MGEGKKVSIFLSSEHPCRDFVLSRLLEKKLSRFRSVEILNELPKHRFEFMFTLINSTQNRCTVAHYSNSDGHRPLQIRKSNFRPSFYNE